MFEFEQCDNSIPSRRRHPILDAKLQQELGRGRIQTHSLVNWGEHCSECVFPLCYRTCSFYEPRPDGRCRRFRFGIYRASTPRTWMKYSGLIEFKSWSKLWTEGNATQLPDGLSALFGSIGTMAWALARPLDWVLWKTTGKKRISLVLQSLRRRMMRQLRRLYSWFPKPDCFLLEIFNPMSARVQLQVSMPGKKENGLGRFEWKGDAGPGPSSFAIAIAEIEACLNLERAFEMNLSVADEDGKTLYISSASFVRFAMVHPSRRKATTALPQRKIKCVVWDLDQTLWNGVLVETGPTGVELKEGLRDLLEELDRRGILMSIASKNSPDDAREVLERLGLWELFLVPQIHWEPKSNSLREIAHRLNLGLDALAFVDDMPFERDEVSSSLPMVLTMPAQRCLSMLSLPEFRGDQSSEGASRRRMYQTGLRREQAQASSSLSFDAFLATCGTRVQIERPDNHLLPRIQDIVQRTNQLNIASQRYEIDELRAMINAADRDCFVISSADNYGDYGHVGFIVIDRSGKQVLIRDCMFSCRIQGKRIDEAVLVYLINMYLSDGATGVWARFIPSQRNSPAGQMLSRLGFVAAAGNGGLLKIEDPAPRPRIDHIEIRGDGARRWPAPASLL